MNLKYTISIKKDTNRIISSSDDKFSGISSGSLLKIDGEPSLYTVSGKESYFYIKNFIVKDSNIIEIDDDIETNLQVGDTIKITYKEYEAKFVVDIINKGIGYHTDDIVSVKGGTSSFDVSIGNCQPTTLGIVETNDDGGVEKINISNPGKYTLIPPSPIEIYSKTGNGLLLEIKYLELGNRSFLERSITNINILNNKTYITLDYSLPLNLESGKLNCDKNCLILSSNYIGDTIKNVRYELFTHFTPNLRIPLLLKNSMSTETVYNKGCLIIDEEIGKIKKHLGIK